MITFRRAHPQAYQESISEICTNRLWRKVQEAAKQAPTPIPVWVRGQTNDEVYVLKRLFRDPFGKIERERSLSRSSEWRLAYQGAGRKERKLVIRMRAEWQVESDKSRFSWEDADQMWDEKAKKYDYPSGYPHTFVTNIEIFPLTIQQAAFVGAQNLKSVYPNWDQTPSIYWGTIDDLQEVQRTYGL